MAGPLFIWSYMSPKDAARCLKYRKSEKYRLSRAVYCSSDKFKKNRADYFNNEDVKKSRANYQLKRLYNITIEEKQSMFDSQRGKCANPNCNFEFSSLSDAHMDHSHETKKVRGLLCGSCNRALGLLKDDENRIIGLATYRQRYNTP
jgi:hypothetical protein